MILEDKGRRSIDDESKLAADEGLRRRYQAVRELGAPIPAYFVALLATGAAFPAERRAAVGSLPVTRPAGHRRINRF